VKSQATAYGSPVHCLLLARRKSGKRAIIYELRSKTKLLDVSTLLLSDLPRLEEILRAVH